jgi:hypothetical protein
MNRRNDERNRGGGAELRRFDNSREHTQEHNKTRIYIYMMVKDVISLRLNE